ncbi:glycosyltransferase involved in cell wall biosynthesis [Bacteroides reticulotermitis]|nr:glycosyltransferase [Bacteroides reticulotermitis]MBB4044044.1 glycosyltransferase involved in cell wall biosynthesis [Bacteroides reticulotermitis]
MTKEKIALVVIRYGEDINGGAEYHCRMLAERLVDGYDVEVLTTCVRNYNTGVNELPAGCEICNGVLVRRFSVAPIDGLKHRQYSKEEKPARKWRRFLFRLGILKYYSGIFPIWRLKREAELKSFLSSPFYSPDMCNYVRENKDQYKVFIPINMAESTTYFTAMEVPSKTLLIPTMHNQGVFFKAIQTDVMTRVAYIGFNTKAEQVLAERVFGKKMAPHGIISVGIEVSEPASWETTREKYKIPSDYLLYMGRIDPGKVGDVFDYFVSYKKKYPQSLLQLVMVGGLNFEQIPFLHKDIVYTGFVSEAEKISILQHAKIVINPSKFESLSLILLEAMNQGKPMLVNGKCAVLREHCIRSNNAALPYVGKKKFISKLYRLDMSKKTRDEMGEKGKQYVACNYDWVIVMSRLKKCIIMFD